LPFFWCDGPRLPATLDETADLGRTNLKQTDNYETVSFPSSTAAKTRFRKSIEYASMLELLSGCDIIYIDSHRATSILKSL
jgi:hypothetical protein